jgi:hypothetical protein
MAQIPVRRFAPRLLEPSRDRDTKIVTYRVSDKSARAGWAMPRLCECGSSRLRCWRVRAGRGAIPARRAARPPLASDTETVAVAVGRDARIDPSSNHS